MPLLIGLAATECEQKISAYLSHHLNLRCVNFRQPVINMIAALTGSDPFAVDVAKPDTIVPQLNCNIRTLSSILTSALILADSDAPKKLLNEQIKKTDQAANLFSGILVRGITRQEEANWVRSQNGIVVHLRTDPRSLKPHRDDIVIKKWTDEKASYKHLAQTIELYARDKAA